MLPEQKKQIPTSWLERPVVAISRINWEVLIFILILIVAVASRFYDLGARVMSHDESLHTYYSWQLYKKGNFEHTPLMHGPLQFHLLAFVFFIFGDSDFTARIPAALCSIATVAFMWPYRRYLGRSGALLAAAFLTISPYMLYYGRYVRNEAFVALFGVVCLWATLRYLDSGNNRYLYWLTAATALHFTAKETAFIYTAQLLLFLGLLFIADVTQVSWRDDKQRHLFLLVMIAALLCLTLGIGVDRYINVTTTPDAGTIAAPLNPDTEFITPISLHDIPPLSISLFAAGLLLLLVSLVLLVKGFGLDQLRRVRSFELMLLLGSLVLPHLAAFPIRLVGWDPMDYVNTTSLLRTASFVLPLMLLSAAIGFWWNRRQWTINAIIFYSIFILFFTTIFTNSTGFFSGLVGSLGYWLEQQGVRRGSQPWYYYLLLQLPVYEYLAALGTLLAAAIGVHLWRAQSPKGKDGAQQTQPRIEPQQRQAVWLLVFWVVTSMIAYTLAGERMPWLTVHITLPMLLLSGWAVGYLIEQVDWQAFKNKGGWQVVVLLLLFLVNFFMLITRLPTASVLEPGKTLVMLRASIDRSFNIMVMAGSLVGLVYLLRNWKPWQAVKITLLLFFTLISLLTVRTSSAAAYSNYDLATEYLVYAHSAPGVKEVMARVEALSRRTTDGLAIQVAFDNDVSWPFTWYLRNYPNQRYFAAEPGRDLRTAAVILVGDDNFHKIEPIVAQGYYSFDYIRMWWPNQDYFDLNPERLWKHIKTPGLRYGIFRIWLDRDYTAYGEASGQDLSLPNWNPSDRMRLYVRKDLLSKMWDYGIGSSEEVVIIDPYEGKKLNLVADQIIYQQDGTQSFSAPRDLAWAEDGSLYVADSQNHRIVKLVEGEIVKTWGGYFAVDQDSTAGAGKFNEPWGLAVSPDGKFVFVADTWNHRIQKFSAQGRFIQQWGSFGQTATEPYRLWGPRDIAINAEGNLLVTDTGNKRVVIYSPDGEYLAHFGGVGFGPGDFDEPVGIAVDPNSGQVYLADTWNQRIQVFMPTPEGNYLYMNEWAINGWYGQSLNNKPYLTITEQGYLYVSDPEMGRVLVYNLEGEFQGYFGDVGDAVSSVGLAMGVAADGQGGLWLSDGQHNQLLHFILP